MEHLGSFDLFFISRRQRLTVPCIGNGYILYAKVDDWPFAAISMHLSNFGNILSLASFLEACPS